MYEIGPHTENSYSEITLGSEHLNLCKELDEIALNGIWSNELWKEELKNPQRICLGIINSNAKKLLALASGWLICNELHLTAIAVHPKHRKKGLARSILTRLLLKAKSKGSKLVTLEVDTENYDAIKFYKAYGFKIIGIRKKYCKNGNDAFIQSLALDDF